MGFDAIKKGLVPIRSCYRWVRDNLFILGLVIFFFLVYRFLPSVFGFLLSFSPIFVCTGVLLQVFFSFGQPNVHNDQKERENNESAEAPSRSRRRRDAKNKIGSPDYRSFPAPASLDDSNATSECSLISNDGSCEMEDEVGSVEGGVKPVEWTEDDEKNLMDLGSSELERNQRLENLIAKRRARKLSRMMAHKDLIDFDNHEFPRIPAVTTKRNDSLLDLPYNPNDASEFSSIPGSAPSVLLPTRNPFDLPYDPLEEKPNLMQDSFQEEFMSVQQQDVHFCRHESFCFGPSFMEPKQDMRDIKFTPFFVTENIASQNVMGGGYPSSKGTNDSVVSSASEPKPLPSPVADLGDQKLFIQQESQASNEGSTSKDICLEENRDVLMVEIPGVDKEITHEMDSNLISVDTGEAYVKPEAPIKYEGLSSSPSAEEDHEKLENLSYITAEGTDNNQNEEPHHDLSPSAFDKKTIDDTSFYVDKGVILTTASSIASDLQVEVSEAGSPPALLDKTFSLTDEDSFVNGVKGVEESGSGNGVPNDVFSNPNDDENELTLNKVTKSSELKPARARLSGDNVDQVAPDVVLETVVVDQVSSDSSLNSVAVEQVSIGTSSSLPPMDRIPSSMSDPLVEQVSIGTSSSLPPMDRIPLSMSDPLVEQVSIGTSSSLPPMDQVPLSMSDPLVEQVSIGTSSYFPPMDQVPLSMSDPVVEQVSIGTSSSFPPMDQVPLSMSDPVVEQVLSDSVLNSKAIEQVSIGTSSSFPPNQVHSPMSDPNFLFEKEKADQVARKSSDGSSLEGLTHPFKGEVSSGSEVQNGVSSHHSNNENVLRSNKVTQSSELEITEDGLSGGGDEPAAQIVVLESMVLEHVSSHSVPESVTVEKVSTDTSPSHSLPMDQVPLPTTDPNILLDEGEKTDQVTGNSSNGSIHPFIGEGRSGNEVPEGADQLTGNSSGRSSHEGLIHHFKGEVTSGNEAPNGTSSHHSDNENELRSNKVTQSSQLETTEDGLSGSSDEPTAQNVVLESMVLERVSSHSVPESVGVEKVSTETSPSYSLPMDQIPLPMSDPNILLDDREKTDQVTGNSSNGSSHENLIHPLIAEGRSGNEVPNGADQVTGNSSGCSSHEGLIHHFKGEVSSGNETPNGPSSHHSDNENESRSKKVVQSSQLETTEDGLSGGSDESTVPNVVLESMVVEKVSSLSVPESVAVEIVLTDSSSYSPPMDQVHLPISDPKITFDEEKEKADPVSCNSSDAMSHEGLTSLTTGKPEPLVEEQIAQPPPEGVHEEPQMQFLIEKPFLNGEEPQELPKIPANSTEETNVIASRSELVVCQDQTEGKQKSMPSEINEGEPVDCQDQTECKQKSMPSEINEGDSALASMVV